MNRVPRGTAAATASVALLFLFSGTCGAAVKFKSSKELAAPALACEPTEIRLVLAGDNAASFVFTVTNSGGKTLDWKVQSCPTWLTLEPRQGSLGQGQRQKITLRVDAKGLRPGLATEGVVAIGSAGRTSPFEILVGVEVLAAARERVVERPPPRVVVEPVPDGDGDGELPPILPASGGLVLDGVEVMAGIGTLPNAFVGVGGRIREAEFGVLWSMGGDDEDWAEAYCGYRKAWEQWYLGGGLTLDFAVSGANGSSNTFGAWYFHGGWRREVESGWWGVDMRVSPAVMQYFEPLGLSVTYGW